MLPRIFRAMLHLYPEDHRALFGAEMAGVFGQRAVEMSERSVAGRVVFYVSEYAGLIGGALRMQLSMARPSSEPWMWSLEAPLIAGSDGELIQEDVATCSRCAPERSRVSSAGSCRPHRSRR